MPLPTVSYLIDKLYISQPRLRERVTRLLYGDSDREVMLFDRPVAINTLRENGYLRAAKLSRRSSLLRDEVIVFVRLAHYLQAGMAFLDIGANIGIFSIMLADFQKAIPGFTVHAFEVHPATFSRLERNAKRFGFTAHNVGISSEPATRTFVEGAVSHVTRLTDHTNRYSIKGREFTARCDRLDSFAFDGPLGMKIDVEGHEYDVLKGSEPFFEAGRVKFVYIDGYGDDERVPDFLKQHGFTLYDCDTMEVATGKVRMLMALHD